jgi:hypothetical protein
MSTMGRAPKRTRLSRLVGGLTLAAAAIFIVLNWEAISDPIPSTSGFLGRILGIRVIVTLIRISVVVGTFAVIGTVVDALLHGRFFKKIWKAEMDETARGLEETAVGGAELEERVSRLEDAADALTEAGQNLDKKLAQLESSVSAQGKDSVVSLREERSKTPTES